VRPIRARFGGTGRRSGSLYRPGCRISYFAPRGSNRVSIYIYIYIYGKNVLPLVWLTSLLIFEFWIFQVFWPFMNILIIKN
jgi:hypothetical protein